MLKTIKLMISGIFVGMAEEQADRLDYEGANWRIKYAIKWAPDEYALTGAHIVNARIQYMLGNLLDSQQSVDFVRNMFESYPEYHNFHEFKHSLKTLDETLGHSVI